nr:oligoendopeptidase F [Maliibacterium massiliense]
MDQKETLRAPQRSQIDAAYKWRLEDIFASDDAFEADFARLPEVIARVRACQGTVGDSARSLLRALDVNFDAEHFISRLFVYARMRRDEDNAVEKYQSFVERVSAMSVELSSAGAYLTPEILDIDAQTLARYQREEQGLAIYARFLHEIDRMRAHYLDAAQEQLIAMTGDMAGAPELVHTMLSDLDLQFGDIPDGKGGRMEVTMGRYRSIMEHPDRAVRKAAFAALYKGFGSVINTMSAALSGSIKKDLFYARARRFDSVRAMNLEDDNVPIAVYDALIDAVEEKLPLLHRYMDLRRRALGVEQVHFYDIYVPLFPHGEEKYTYEQAKALVQRAVAPIGETYAGDFARALAGGWVDVYENKGKSSGAYSWGVYGTHPFVLMNYQGSLEDVSTLAHEMGHAMHSFYSQAGQPYPTADYSIFVAEVASTVNEWLLLDHLLATSTDDRLRASLLATRLETIRTTCIRQVQFAAFERDIHAHAQAGEALTANYLCDTYYNIVKRYYGEQMACDEQIAMEWAIVSHFYRAFYVYQYATGLSAAAALAEGIAHGDGAARYMAFLASGSSADVLELLRRAGVDLSTPAPTLQLMDIFAQTLDQLEQLAQKHGWLAQ